MRQQPTNRYIPGDYLRNCDICDFTYLRSELKKNSDGLIVCRKDYEPKHPRLFNTSVNKKERPFKGD